MRFYRAIEITAPEASFLMESSRGAAGRPSVVSFDGVWYDVRALNDKELESFIDELARVRNSRGSSYSH
jgi:hypothetical protein